MPLARCSATLHNDINESAMTIALISVREASTRLPAKCFLPFGDTHVLGHVIQRCIHFGFLPVVATTERDTRIVDFCKDVRVHCVQGSEDDKLERWLQACKKLKFIDAFVTVDCDDPFFDKALTEKLYVDAVNAYSGTILKPDLRAYLGAMGWGMNLATLEQICAKKTDNNTEMIWKHFGNDVFIKQVDANPKWIERKMRLTLDYQEDYWLLSVVLRELGPYCTREDIIDFFTANQSLTLINEFRNVEWKKRQSE